MLRQEQELMYQMSQFNKYLDLDLLLKLLLDQSLLRHQLRENMTIKKKRMDRLRWQMVRYRICSVRFSEVLHLEQIYRRAST